MQIKSNYQKNDMHFASQIRASYFFVQFVFQYLLLYNWNWIILRANKYACVFVKDFALPYVLQ